MVIVNGHFVNVVIVNGHLHLLEIARRSLRMARKKHAGARTKSGRKSRAYKGPARDNGTPELQHKRIAMANGADPALTAWAPGILHAHGHLSRAQYGAAISYGALHAAVFGAPWAQPGTGSEANESELCDIKERLQTLEACMTLEQRAAVLRLVSLNYIPSWFFFARSDRPCLPEDALERKLLLSGLNVMLVSKQRRRAA
jgi:hypothetical protein